MTCKIIKLSELPAFDMAEHLPDEHAIMEYLTIVLEKRSCRLGRCAWQWLPACGMTDIAKAWHYARALYKALRPNANPASTPSAGFVLRWASLVAQPIHTQRQRIREQTTISNCVASA